MAVTGLNLDTNHELTALNEAVRLKLIRHATSDWATLIPCVVGDHIRIVSELKPGVSLEARYPGAFVICGLCGEPGCERRCGDLP